MPAFAVADELTFDLIALPPRCLHCDLLCLPSTFPINNTSCVT
jgi:hypothetical protein